MATDNDNWIIPLAEEEEDDIEAMFGPHDIEAELDRFRQQWCHELQMQQGHQVPSSGDQGNVEQKPQPSREDQARYLFLQGVYAEQAHHLYEAIQYYRRAVQLVPDIEFRISDYSKHRYVSKARQRQESESSEGSIGAVEEEEDLSNLIQRFSRLNSNPNAICQPVMEPLGTHISELPVEVIQYILKWVISSDLDIVALERVAMVCRGFYILARDEELWRNICQRIWGLNCGSPKAYGTWRDMYLGRPHLCFHGCYISKMSYFRQGEKGLHNFYKPFHLVEYYRYVRFFPEGKILMLTSPDDPYTALPSLKTRHSRVQGMLYGYYKMAGNQVTAVLTRLRMQETTAYRYKRQRIQDNQNESDQTFYVEFSVADKNRRSNCQLEWMNYSVNTTYKSSGQESVADFELSKQNYPNLIFSCVRSFTAVCNSPLSGK